MQAAADRSFISDWRWCPVAHCALDSRRPVVCRFSQSQCRPLRYAVLGAGFAGLSVVWHLLKQSPKEMNLQIDIFDEVGIGGGASGVSGGLLHPYSPKVKLLRQGADCWSECLKLLSIAQTALDSDGPSSELGESGQNIKEFVIRRRGILRPATNVKSLDALNNNAQNGLSSCRIETIGKDAAQLLVPNMCLPLNTAFYMPDALTVHPPCYLRGLFLACKNLVKELAASGFGGKVFSLHQKSISNLCELEGEYDGVIICLGAKADTLPQLSGKLPLRTCRGVITHLQLPDDIGEYYPDHGPSVLSNAWLAVQGTRSLLMGSTKEWKSRNSSPYVSTVEAFNALEELLPKAFAVYPGIKDWSVTGARAGLRALPPMTPEGQPPMVGCIDDLVGNPKACKYWLFGGLGSRGLLYHGWFGKLVARAALSCNEQIIPSNFTSWKNVTR